MIFCFKQRDFSLLACMIFLSALKIYSQTPLWIDIHNNVSNLDDEGRKITVDREGNIICGGYTTFSGTKGSARNYLLIKYNQSGSRLWTLITGSGSGGSTSIGDLKVDT